MNTGQHRIRTMVVDDSPAAVHAISSMLERNSAVELVGTAQDGREALSIAHTLRPELVLLDVEMPVMNGIETAREMNHKFPSTRLIMVTVHDCPELRQICRDAGADAFIPKDHLKEEFPLVLEQLFSHAG